MKIKLATNTDSAPEMLAPLLIKKTKCKAQNPQNRFI